MMKSETTVISKQLDNNGFDEPIPDSHSSRTPEQAPNLTNNSNSSPLRRGKWTPEEEAYCHAAIRDFKSGYLNCALGSTLRTYLSEKLECDPMRITKKFTGDASIGKKVFRPAIKDDPKMLKEIEKSQAKHEDLHQKWRQRLESQEQDMARKSMAASAVSVASSCCDNMCLPPHSTASSSHQLLPGTETTSAACVNNAQELSEKSKHDITKAATWLEQAEKMMFGKTESNQVQEKIEDEMKAISHLISEAPVILAISAKLHQILGNTYTVESSDRLQSSTHKLRSCPDHTILCTDSDFGHPEQAVSTPIARKRKHFFSGDENVTNSPDNPMKILASLSSQAVPVPINVNSSNISHLPAIQDGSIDVEDAKAFVGFLQSVVNVNK